MTLIHTGKGNLFFPVRNLVNQMGLIKCCGKRNLKPGKGGCEMSRVWRALCYWASQKAGHRRNLCRQLDLLIETTQACWRVIVKSSFARARESKWHFTVKASFSEESIFTCWWEWFINILENTWSQWMYSLLKIFWNSSTVILRSHDSGRAAAGWEAAKKLTNFDH